MKKLFLSLAACAALFSANAGTQWMMGTTPFEVDTLYQYTAGPGMTTTGLRLSWTSDGVYSTNVHYTEVDLTNPNLEIRGVQPQDKFGGKETVRSMAKRKTAQGNGQYIAGVNGDFFNLTGKPTMTLSADVVDGVVYGAGSASNGSWGKWATHVMVKGKKDLVVGQNFKAGNTMIFPGKQTVYYQVNGGRGENGLVIYTPDSISTNTNPWGQECKIKLVSGEVGKSGAVYEVTEAKTGYNTPVPSDGFVLSGHGSTGTLVGNLAVGDRLTTSSSMTYNGVDVAGEINQAIGGCSMIVIDGKSAPDEYFASSVVDHFPSSQARTAIGYNKDRSKLIMLVADKYSKLEDGVTNAEKISWGQKSNGFFMYRMAQLMVNLGCYTAMAFDGGGSSNLYNKEIGCRNVPYGGTYERPVANGIFAVETTPVDNEIAMIEVRNKKVDIAVDSVYTPTVFGYNQYGVLVDGNVNGFTLTVAPELGTVDGTAIKAGSAAASTKAVVTYNGLKAAFDLSTNGGGQFVSSSDEEAPYMIKAPYVSDEPMGIDKEPVYLTEKWHFVNDKYNDGWDGTAPNWANPDSIKAKICPRFATGFNGRFYTVDMMTMSIAEIDEKGELKPLYKLPSLEGRVVNDVPDYYGVAITSDDYGHFLVGHYFTKEKTNVWTVYDPKTGKAKHFDLPTNASSLRVDNVGRVVGNLLNEAYVFVSPKGTGNLDSQHVNIIHFADTTKAKTNALENVVATVDPSVAIYMSNVGNTTGICQPKYETVEETKNVPIANAFYNYSIQGEGIPENVNLFNGASANYARTWGNYSALSGFDTFTLEGRRYFVVAYATKEEFDANNKSGQHIVVMNEDGMCVADWNNPDYVSAAGFNTITARKMDEQNVNIYVYNCTGSPKPGCIAGAILRFSVGEFTPDEPVDISSKGYDFDQYEEGDEFKLTAVDPTGVLWTAPAGMYHISHPDAFDKDGHLTVFVDRGTDAARNSTETVETKVSPAYTVHKLTPKSGKVLVLNQGWSPYGFSQFDNYFPNYASGGAPQLNFYINSDAITQKTTQRHYVRVKIVYNLLRRGCHHLSDVNNNAVKPLASIYSTHENNYVIPAQDNLLGDRVSDTGIDFAKWVDEGNSSASIPENPEVYVPTDEEADPLDNVHANAHAKAYLMNPDRYRVYEFDTYIDNPSVRTTSVQLSMNIGCVTYAIKEIKFTDLGTDEADATLLGRRVKSWIYADEFDSPVTGIEDINAEEVEEGADAEPVYFNLQGVQVANPDNGIYIVRRGNKVTKEYIRK